MPIHVITGQPGDGKTLRMMEILAAEAKAGNRPLFQHGIDGLKPGYCTDLDDPREWNALDPLGEPTCHCPAVENPHAHVIPDGAMIFIDEAWQRFGHLHNAARAATPKHVLDLAIHRHRGLDFVMTTQLPNQLYPFMRGLIGKHTHMRRIFGSKWSTMYEWGELVEDVKSSGQRAIAVQTKWSQPKHLFSMYKSASLHTIKAKFPKRLWLIPVGAVVVGLLWYYGLGKLAHPPGVPSEAVVTESRSGAAGLPGSPQAASSENATPTTPEGWQAWTKPVLPGIPYTAPMFAGRTVVAVPRTFCMIYGDDVRFSGTSTCHCMTEQGTTPPDVSDGLCRNLAVNGYYDPFQAPRPATVAPAASSVGSVETSPGIATIGFGDHQVGPDYAPPEGGVGAQPQRGRLP